MFVISIAFMTQADIGATETSPTYSDEFTLTALATRTAFVN